MRLAAPIALALLLAAPAAAGPLRLGIETPEAPRDPFLVSVSGHYADFHNGHSHHWKDALVPAGGRHWIPLGPVNPLLNMGVSVTVYHPEYVVEAARTRKTPLLVRPVFFESFRPRAWRDVVASGPGEARTPAQHPIWQVSGHLELFLLRWLPAMDAAGGDAAADAALLAYLPLFDSMVAFAEAAPAGPRPRLTPEAPPEQQASFARSLERQELEQRAALAELSRRARAWLSVPRAERVRVRVAMQAMRTPRGLGERLLGERDRARLGGFLDRYVADREERREPEDRTSWTDPETRITYRVRILDPPPGCAFLAIATDLTSVVTADLGEMTHDVKAQFCQRPGGEWRYGRP